MNISKLVEIIQNYKNEDISPEISSFLDLPVVADERGDEGDESDEIEYDIASYFSELPDSIVKSIYWIICFVVYVQFEPLEMQFFSYLEAAINTGKRQYMRTLTLEELFIRNHFEDEKSIDNKVLTMLVIIEMMRKRESLVGKNADEIYNQYFFTFHEMLSSIDLVSGHLICFNNYVCPSSRPPYLHILILRCFSMKLISEEDMLSIRQLSWHRDQMLWPDKIRRIYGRSICPSLDTLIRIEEQKMRDTRKDSDGPPVREIVPIIKTKMSQKQAKAARAAAAGSK
jgi:hypothetical protein